MRIALLSTLERTVDGSPRAFLKLGGRPLIAWQIDLAKALHCESLLCIAEGGDDVPQQMRELAKAAGIPIELIGGPRHLLGKITADQEIVVIADGLVIDTELAVESFAKSRGVAALADYPAVEAGFERIDPEHAWAGLLVARGAVAEQLADMPADGDTVSLLLRMALQSGTRLVRIDEMHIGTGEILLAKDASALSQREKALLDGSTTRHSWWGPAEALAGRISRRLAPDALNKGPGIALISGSLLTLGAVAGAGFGFATGAHIALVLAAFALALSAALRRLRSRLEGGSIDKRFGMIINGLFDLSLVAVLALGIAGGTPFEAVFKPILLIGLWRLTAALVPSRFAPLWHDRTVLAACLLALAVTGWLTLAMPAIILALLGMCLISEGSARLTRV